MSYPLFFDKYYGNHQYSNETTRKVTYEILNSDKSYTIKENEKAINECNKLPDAPYYIPELDNNIYKVVTYSRIESNQLKSCYTIIMLNTKNIKKCIENDKIISNYDFLKTLVRYHNFYEKAINNEHIFASLLTDDMAEEIIFGNICKVVQNVMTATKYHRNEMIDDPEDITVQLFDYQKCSIYWMLQKEKNKKTIFFNVSEEVCVGDIYFDLYKNKFNLVNKRKKLTFNGGGIIDEVGLGKTVQMTTLALLNQKSDKKYIIKNSPYFQSRATLVICPNHLCQQWKRELKKMISPSYNPIIITLFTKTHFDKTTYHQMLDADFIIMSFTFFDNKAFTREWIYKLATNSKSYHKSQSFNHKLATTKFIEMAKELIKDPVKSLVNKKPLIQLINFHRLVVDEFHEIYTNKKYIYMKNLIQHINATHKWVVSGTPFNDDNNLFHALEYLTNYNNIDGKQIMGSQDIIKYLCVDCFRRNTKNSVEDEFKLESYTEKIIWLDFTVTERVMYNAYIANPSNSQYDEYLRKLCCHPNLAEETKQSLSNCKSLEDIEKVMFNHYKVKAKLSFKLLQKTKEKIKTLKKKIKEKEQSMRINKIKRELIKKIAKEQNINDDDVVLPNNTIEEKYYEKFNTYIIKEFEVESYDSDYDEVDNLFHDKLSRVTDNQDLELIEDNELDIDNNIVTNKDSLSALKDSLQRVLEKYKKDKQMYKGHKTTYIFYNNVMNRLRKTVNTIPIKKKSEPIIIDKDTNIMDLLEAGDDTDEDEDDNICGICLGEIVNGNVGVIKCGHIFCFSCLNDMYEMSMKSKYCIPKCPTCRKNIRKESILKLSCVMEKNIDPNKDPTKLNKQELINKVGTKLANLISFLRENQKHTIIFSQWHDLLTKIGVVLKEHGIKNIFCKGNAFQKDKAVRKFNNDDSIKVIMLSSDSAASGTNLTKATQIILIDPVYGTYQHRKDIEEQAIGRSNRLGQTEKLYVIRFVIRNTIEEIIYNKNLEEDKNQPGFEERIIIEVP